MAAAGSWLRPGVRKLLYRVTTVEGATLCVKFTQHYNQRVHAAWAQAGLAPALISVKTLPGGWHMVSMELLGQGWACLDDVLVNSQSSPQVQRLLPCHIYVFSKFLGRLKVYDWNRSFLSDPLGEFKRLNMGPVRLFPSMSPGVPGAAACARPSAPQTGMWQPCCDKYWGVPGHASMLFIWVGSGPVQQINILLHYIHKVMNEKSSAAKLRPVPSAWSSAGCELMRALAAD